MSKGKIILWPGLPAFVGALAFNLIWLPREPVKQEYSLSGRVPADRRLSSTPVTNTVTATSILKDISYKPVAASLLAFISREDDRPWYVDDALLLLQFPKGQWMLVHAARNPRYPPGQKPGSKRWSVSQPTDSPPVGFQSFDHRPAREEMDQFLKDNEWQFESDKSWRVVNRVVDEATWQRVLGYKSPLSDKRNQSAGPKQQGLEKFDWLAKRAGK